MIVRGEPVELRFTKWPGDRHWHHDCVWLGSDEHGDWVGQVAGARSHRPGADFVAETDNISLVPAASTEWVATQFPPGHPPGLGA